MATNLTASEFARDANRAWEAARDGPVFITEHGRPGHVLLSFEAYQRLAGEASLLSVLAADDDLAFEPARLGGPLHRVADL